MGNATWLFFALPNWYFSTILSPFSADFLTAIPVLGILCLAVGVVLGIVKRKTSLLIFLLLPAASQILVVVAGFMRGALQDASAQPVLWTFLLLQVALAGYLVWRLKSARLPAALLAGFTSSYAFFATFVAAMAFSDSWL